MYVSMCIRTDVCVCVDIVESVVSSDVTGCHSDVTVPPLHQQIMIELGKVYK